MWLLLCTRIILKLFRAAWRHSWLKPSPSRASCLLLWIFTESHRLICSATVVFLLPLPSDGSMISDYEWRPIWPLSRPTQWRQTQGCYSSFLSISSVSVLPSDVCMCVYVCVFVYVIVMISRPEVLYCSSCIWGHGSIQMAYSSVFMPGLRVWWLAAKQKQHLFNIGSAETASVKLITDRLLNPSPEKWSTN